jgi:hypothetical protein
MHFERSQRFRVVQDQLLELVVGELRARAGLLLVLRALDRLVRQDLVVEVERDVLVEIAPEHHDLGAGPELCVRRPRGPVPARGVRERDLRVRLEVPVEREAEGAVVGARRVGAVPVPAAERVDRAVPEDDAVIPGEPVVPFGVRAALDDVDDVLEGGPHRHRSVVVDDEVRVRGAVVHLLEDLPVHAAVVLEIRPVLRGGVRRSQHDGRRSEAGRRGGRGGGGGLLRRLGRRRDLPFGDEADEHVRGTAPAADEEPGEDVVDGHAARDRGPLRQQRREQLHVEEPREDDPDGEPE